MADLEEAIDNSRQSVALTSADSPDRPRRLHYLSVWLRTHYERTGALADLEEAIACCHEAVALSPALQPSDAPDGPIVPRTPAEWARWSEEDQALPDSDERPERLDYLGTLLHDRFGRTGTLADLQEAIASLREAVALTHPSSLDLPARLHSLGTALHDRYERTKTMADLEAANQTRAKLLNLAARSLDDPPIRARPG
jgi:hypothetical protein